MHLRIHRLANLATVLATLQKERVIHLEKIVADEVLLIVLGSFYTENHIFIIQGGSWSSWINSGFTLGNGELTYINQKTESFDFILHCTFSHRFNACSSQVKHYQFRQVCLATGLNPAPSPDILLLAWARSAPGLEQAFDFYPTSFWYLFISASQSYLR